MDIQFLSEYLEYLDAEKGLSENTISAYGRDLSAFLSLCEENGADEITKIERANINDYIMKLYEKKYSPTSVMRKIASLRGFFKCLCATEICKKNPTVTLEQPKVPKKLPKVMSEIG